MSKLTSPTDLEFLIPITLSIEMDMNNGLWKTENGIRTKLDENNEEYKALRETIDSFRENPTVATETIEDDEFDFDF
ncbi:hypothetical protein [Flavobacterium sp. LAR06]|uniref:hypothetical protein n=1 Tax=Flavobacterium sp. LAR06 TaxID=3064897 RepID=UPI0035BEFBB6